MVIVLCYHKISNIRNDYNMINVTPDHFRQQMKYLSGQYRVIPLEDLCMKAAESDECVFAVTFDDGYRDVFCEALPILEELRIPATAFVTTGNLGTWYENWMDNIIRAIFEPGCKKDYFECSEEELAGRWYTRDIEEKTAFYRKINFLFRHIGVKRRRKYEYMLLKWAELPWEGRENRRILSVQELRELSKSSFVSIGTHCVTHPSLGAVTKEEQEFEISNSIGVLEDITGLPIKYMAYPFGSKSSYTAETMDLLKRYGIEMAFTTSNERISRETDPYQIPRIVMGNYGLDDFQYVINNIISRQSAEKEAMIKEKTMTGNTSYYVGSIEKDMQLLEGKKDIVVWGCGFWGKNLYDDLKLLNLQARVVAFGDNDPRKTGRLMDGIPVLSKPDILKMAMKEDLLILVKNSQDLEIYDDLKKSGFKEIHLIVR